MKRDHKQFMSGIAIALLFLGASSCNQVGNVALNNFYEIRKPFKNITVQPLQFAVDPSRDTVLKLESGTAIHIPAGVIVDKDNKPIGGGVNLEYKEYHKPAEILLSGIPMMYDTGGATYGFESAGMFEITAADESGQPLFISDDGSIDVRMGSFREGDDFSFYYFDTVAGQWQYLSGGAAATNEEKGKQMDSITDLLQQTEEMKTSFYNPKAYQKGDKILNLDVDYSRFAELKPFHAVIWRYAGKGGNDDPTENEWIYKEKWSGIYLEKYGEQAGLYTLKLSGRKKKFSTIVEPVLQGNDLMKAQAEFDAAITKYEKTIAAISDERRRLERQANMSRFFSVARFGIFNWDKIYKEPQAVSVMAEFRFDQDVPGAESVIIYHVIENRNAVLSYRVRQCQFTFMPTEDNKLIAVLPDESVAVLSTGDFRKLAAPLYDDPEQRLIFTLKVKDDKIASPDQLSDLLASL